MTKLDGVAAVLDQLKGLQPKVAAQIARRVLMLGLEPLPQDSAELAGYQGLRRVDSGEYRIVYRYHELSDVAEILLIGKRNDDEVYRRLRRLMG